MWRGWRVQIPPLGSGPLALVERYCNGVPPSPLLGFKDWTAKPTTRWEFLMTVVNFHAYEWWGVAFLRGPIPRRGDWLLEDAFIANSTPVATAHPALREWASYRGGEMVFAFEKFTLIRICDVAELASSNSSTRFGSTGIGWAVLYWCTSLSFVGF